MGVQPFIALELPEAFAYGWWQGAGLGDFNKYILTVLTSFALLLFRAASEKKSHVPSEDGLGPAAHQLFFKHIC